MTQLEFDFDAGLKDIPVEELREAQRLIGNELVGRAQRDEGTGYAAAKIASEVPNGANRVLAHLASLGLEPLFSHADAAENVYIVGSNVCFPALNMPAPKDADVDIIIEGDDVYDLSKRREAIVKLLGLEWTGNETAPSMVNEREAATLPGRKYIRKSDGREFDIWGMESILVALDELPAATHSDRRMAWDADMSYLIQLPNGLAPVRNAPERPLPAAPATNDILGLDW